MSIHVGSWGEVLAPHNPSPPVVVISNVFDIVLNIAFMQTVDMKIIRSPFELLKESFYSFVACLRCPDM